MPSLLLRTALLVAATLVLGLSAVEGIRSFGLSPNGATLLKDGQPHRVLSGGFHYFRSPHTTWDLRLATLKASGVNAVQTYIAWNWHCPNEFEPCDFVSGDRNISHFLHLAQRHGLDVMLRAGPYICAEWDFGGFPAWILRQNASIAVRTMDPLYLSYVAAWYQELFAIVLPWLYGHGGPVVMVQVENEYGSYGSDTQYLAYLRDLFRAALGPDVLLYSTDGNAAWYVDRSATPGIYQAVDFGPGSNASASWVAQRTNMGTVSPVGPPFNDEMYTGWLPQWGDAYVPDNSIASVVAETHDIMVASSNASSMNFYMFFGGTNFGFMASYSVTTSYDYGAPMNETGHPTAKFEALRAFFPSIGPLGAAAAGADAAAAVVPAPPPLQTYGAVTFTAAAPLYDPHVLAAIASNSSLHRNVPVPPSMEALGQSYGYIGYTVNLTEVFEEAEAKQEQTRRHRPGASGALACITLSPYDYAVAYLDGTCIGHLIKGINTTLQVPPALAAARSLLVLVENAGRISFFSNHGPHSRGLFSPVYVNTNTLVTTFAVTNLDMAPAQLDRLPWAPLPEAIDGEAAAAAAVYQPGVFFRGTLTIPRPANTTSAGPGATLLDMRGFGKGFVTVNGHNLGRFWSVQGPQYSLHCPAEFLRFSTTSSSSHPAAAGEAAGSANEIIVYEQAAPFGAVPPVLTFASTNYNTLKPEGPAAHRPKEARHV